MRVGIMGCGTIAQTMHIPHVLELPEMDLVALADPAEERVSVLADRHNVSHRFADGAAMVDELGETLDATLVLTPWQHHADAAEVSLDHGIHTFVEKPLAGSVRDADRLVEAAARSDAVAMVGYMKRFAPAFERLDEMVAELGEIDLVTAYHVDPDYEAFLDESYDLVPGTPPADLVERSGERRMTEAKDAIGTDDRELAERYSWHLEHCCHDVNLLRQLFGRVSRLDHVDLYAGGRYLTAKFRFAGDMRCMLHSGDSDRRRFEQFLRIDTPTQVVELTYANPYLRNSPPTLDVRPEGNRSHAEGPDQEPFKRELQAFAACIREGRSPRTSFTDAREDVRLVADLFRHLDGRATLGDYPPGGE